MRRVRSRLMFAALALAMLAGCTTPPVQRVALLAPFEGRHREIGYQALYAARMAIAEAERPHLELLAIDDGGTRETAQDRVRALRNDPLVSAVLLLGPHPTHPETVALLRADQQALIIGDWAAYDATAPGAVCGDLCQLVVFRTSTEDLGEVTITTTAPPVTDEFTARYLAFDSFAPPPLPLARLTYDTTAAWLHGEPPPTATYRYTYDVGGALQQQP